MSKELLNLEYTRIGYRNNYVSEFGKATRAQDILDFEYNELGNEDIIDYLYDNGFIGIPSYEDALEFIKAYEEGFDTPMYALWLCASIEDVIENFPDEYDYPKNKIKLVDAYELPGWYRVLSDLGEQGILIMSMTDFEDEYLEEIEI